MAQPSFTARVFVVAATFCLAWLTWVVLRSVAVPALWAALLALMLWPLNVRARRLLGNRCGAAAALLTVGSAIGAAGPAALTGVEFIQEATKLAKHLGSILRNAPASSPELRADWEVRLIHRIQRSLPPQFELDLETVRERIIAALGSGLEFIIAHLGNAFLGAIGVASGLVLSLFILFYLFRDGERMFRAAIAMIPLDAPRKAVLVDHLGAVTRALVVGTLATAAAQGALVSIAFAILHLPAPVVFGVITAIVSVLPFGTGLVFVPAAIALALMSRFVAAGFMMFWGLFVVSSIDNFIRPRIVSRRAKVPTLAVFLGILGGIASFDLIGVFLGPLVLVTALETAHLLLIGPPTPGAGAAIDPTAKADETREG